MEGKLFVCSHLLRLQFLTEDGTVHGYFHGEFHPVGIADEKKGYIIRG